VTAFAPLLNLLADVPDPRRAQGKLYQLQHVAAVRHPRHCHRRQFVPWHRHLHRCSGAQSKCGRRAIKGGFRRRLAETIGGIRRTLFENERTIGETDARSNVPTQNA